MAKSEHESDAILESSRYRLVSDGSHNFIIQKKPENPESDEWTWANDGYYGTQLNIALEKFCEKVLLTELQQSPIKIIEEMRKLQNEIDRLCTLYEDLDGR